MSSSPAFHTQVCVIGAGVVGLAVARALSLAGKEVLLVDRAATIGSETSSRNSEVIHAGLYYPSESLKAKFCVRGKHLLYDFCKMRHIPFNNCGKLIVATKEDQLSNEIEALRQKAIKNGVEDVRIISKEDVKVMEPEVECNGALWSPSTGVLDSHSFFNSLLADGEKHGVTLALQSSVQDAQILTNTNINEPHLRLKFDDGTWIASNAVINAAGLWAHQIAQFFHSSQAWQPPRHYFAKGTYFQLKGFRDLPFRQLIYPVPEPGGLGVHATVDWARQSVKFGPDVEWVDSHIQDPTGNISLNPELERGDKFYDEVRKYWPSLPDGALVPDYVGIRPKLNHPSNGTLAFEDFRIVGTETHGVQGLIHLFGIESPGLTSSMAIGEYISNLLSKI